MCDENECKSEQKQWMAKLSAIPIAGSLAIHFSHINGEGNIWDFLSLLREHVCNRNLWEEENLWEENWWEHELSSPSSRHLSRLEYRQSIKSNEASKTTIFSNVGEIIVYDYDFKFEETMLEQIFMRFSSEKSGQERRESFSVDKDE